MNKAEKSERLEIHFKNIAGSMCCDHFGRGAGMKRCVLMIFIFLCATISVSAQSKEKFEPKILIEGKWGTGPGEFGYLLKPSSGDTPESKEHNIVVGPTCLSVGPMGEIFILDTVNKRIQKFNSAGTYLNSIPLEFPEDIVIDNYALQEMLIDDEGRIYARYSINNFSWLVFSKDGKLIQRLVSEEDLARMQINRDKHQKDIEAGKYARYSNNPALKQIEIDRIKDKRQRMDKLFHNDRRTTLINWRGKSGAKISPTGKVYIGGLFFSSSTMKAASLNEMAQSKLESLNERYQKARRTTEAVPYHLENGQQIATFNGSEGDEYVAADGTIYKLVRSFDAQQLSSVIVIRWNRGK